MVKFPSCETRRTLHLVMSVNLNSADSASVNRLRIPTESEVLNLLYRLEEYIPYSLPLYRRLQFYLGHPPGTSWPPHAQIFHASFQDGIVRTNQVNSNGNGASPLQDETVWPAKSSDIRPLWLAAHVDMSRAGETQIWIFANWECPDNGTSLPVSSQETKGRKALLRSFLKFVYSDCVPLMPLTPPDSYTSTSKRRPGHVYSPATILIGSCHHSIRSLIPDTAVGKIESPCLKYIFPSSSYERIRSSLPNDKQDPLPQGYRYAVLRQPQDLNLALSRTNIPRRPETLAMLPSRAIFYQNELNPVAWGFIGLDASLTTLHTELEHRGKGLAVLLARELLRIQDEHFKTLAQNGDENLKAEGRVGWGHADVEHDNLRSRRVMEKAGGSVVWENCWVELELERLFGKGGLWSDV